MWRNDFDDFAVLDATTFLSARGHLKAHADWGSTVNTADLAASALFGVWVGFPGPGVASSSYDRVGLGAVGAFATPLIGGETNGRTVSAGVQLHKALVAVPPRQHVVFEVALALEWRVDGGNVEADFGKGAFVIGCPVVVVALRNQPGSAIA